MSTQEKKSGRVRSLYITKRKNYTATTVVMSVKIPLSLLKQIDQLIEKGYYQNRSDFVRDAVRRLLAEHNGFKNQLSTGLVIAQR